METITAYNASENPKVIFKDAFAEMGFCSIRLVGGPLGGLDYNVPVGVIPGDVLRLHTVLVDETYEVVWGPREPAPSPSLREPAIGPSMSRTLVYRRIEGTNAYLFEGME